MSRTDRGAAADALAGACATKAAMRVDRDQFDGELAEYVASVHRDLIPDMDAGRRILAALSFLARA